MGDVRDGCRCSVLETEVAALEQLVGRYQQELIQSTSCGACRRRPHQSLKAAEEELFECQQLDALQWGEGENAATRFATRTGRQCELNEVVLPSSEWIWTSDWHVDVTSKTDVNGWTYAFSQRDLDEGIDCRSDRTVEHRARRRRWKRERKFVGSHELPRSVSLALASDARLCALESANEKLTEQLRRANDQIIEYEDRLRAYEAKLLEMQNAAPPKRPSRIITSLKRESSVSSATPFSPSHSRDVLSQTEALLSQILGTPQPVLDEETQEAQRRRSQVVMECQSELDGAVTEFHSLVQTLEDPRKAVAKPTLGA